LGDGGAGKSGRHLPGRNHRYVTARIPVHWQSLGVKAHWFELMLLPAEIRSPVSCVEPAVAFKQFTDAILAAKEHFIQSEHPRQPSRRAQFHQQRNHLPP